MLERIDFNDNETLARALALSVSSALQKGVKNNGMASLAVSGGSTPKLFLAELAKISALDWSKIIVTLVDERWVDISSPRSNAALVSNNLLQGNASQAAFIPLYLKGQSLGNKQVETINYLLNEHLPMPVDVAVLGMGNDGHTASFFPGAKNLQSALSNPGPAIAISAPQTQEQRVTLTLPFILQAKHLYLHIEGEEKQQALQLALNGNDVAKMPVRAVLEQKQTDLKIYWCP